MRVSDVDDGCNAQYIDGGYLVRGSRFEGCVRTFDVTEFHVPEPITVAMLLSGGMGLGGVILMSRRRK